MKILLIMIILVVLSGCVMHDPSTMRALNTPISEGMTTDEVRATWGIPWRSQSERLGDVTYDTYLYRRRSRIYTGFGPAREYVDYDTVYFRNGKVMGGSW